MNLGNSAPETIHVYLDEDGMLYVGDSMPAACDFTLINHMRIEWL